jgi:hypothetical protein
MSSRARVHTCAAVAAAFIFSTAAAAQEAPAPDRNIVVTGERPPATENQVTEQAKNISIVGDPLDQPLPRFEDWVCPGVLGLKDDAAAYIIQRIRYNAEQLDLRMTEDNGSCEPNFIVAFVDDAQNALVEVARRNGYMLAGLSVTERGELLDAPGAARVWSNVMARTRDGMPVPSERDARSAPERAGSTFAGTDGGGNPLSAPFNMGVPPVSAGWNAHSKIYIATREDITSVLVLFDRSQVHGKSLLQLADYATMRGFALTRETSGEHPAPTILSLFDGDGPKPERLTAFDLGYLGSLYRDMPNLPAQAKIAGVNAEMERQASSRE